MFQDKNSFWEEIEPIWCSCHKKNADDQWCARETFSNVNNSNDFSLLSAPVHRQNERGKNRRERLALHGHGTEINTWSSLGHTGFTNGIYP